MKGLDYLAQSLGTAGWQAAVLALLIGLYLRMCGRWMPSAGPHLLWLIPLIRLLLPELPRFSWSFFSWSEAPAAVMSLAAPAMALPKAGMAAPEAPAAAATASPLPWLLVLWLAGLLAVAAHWAFRWIRTARWIRQLGAVSQPGVHALLAEGCQAFGIRTPPGLRQFQDNRTPALAGLWKPILLLPRSLLEKSSEAALRHVLWHELAHLKRRDPWILSLARFACMLHWYNPAAWWIFRQLARACEPASDALAVRHLGQEGPTAYARTLLGLMEQNLSPGQAWVLGILEPGSSAGSRIKLLLKARPGRIALGSALAALLFFACLGLTSRPPGSPAPEALVIEIEPRLVEITDPENAAAKQLLEETLASADSGKIAQIKGADFLSAPSVAVKDGEKAKIAVTREFRYPTEYEWSEDANTYWPVHFETRDVGIVLELKPKVQGSHIFLSGTAANTEFEGFAQQ
jgi:beta-lactamase regulating signal transducer with metallopeptidase domain